MSQSGSQASSHLSFSKAGKALPEGTRFIVNDCVFVKDGNACDSVEYAKCFKALPDKAARRHPLDISARIAVFLILLALLVSGLKIMNCFQTQWQLKTKMTVLHQQAEKITENNAALALRLTQARDEARICYIASRELGMISAEGTDVIFLHAPDTRPLQTDSQGLSHITGISSAARK